MSPEDRLDVVILAAGEGRRLGHDKATLPWGETSLLRHVFNQFPLGRVRRCVVVANPRNEAAARRMLPADVEVVVNVAVGSEMIASVRLGIEVLAVAGGAVCIHPVDVFAVSRRLVALLHDAWRVDREHIHLPVVGGKGGHPVLLPRELLPAVRAIPVGCGLDYLLRERSAVVVHHAWHDERLLVDLDTPGQYARYQPPVGSTHARAILRFPDERLP